MQRAANQTHESLQQHQRFIDDWLSRYEAIVNREIQSRKNNQSPIMENKQIIALLLAVVEEVENVMQVGLINPELRQAAIKASIRPAVTVPDGREYPDPDPVVAMEEPTFSHD